jgi:death-on-curing protein
MRYLTVSEVLDIYSRVLQQTDGLVGIRDIGALESAVMQPRATFDGKELYPDLAAKAAALGFSLIENHPFVDGNKRTGHASAEMMLVLNDYQISAEVDEQVEIVLQVAAGQMKRAAFTEWLRAHVEVKT